MKLARFCVSAIFLLDIMKHGLDAARVVENPLPEDAIFHSMYTDSHYRVVWIVVASESFALLEEGALIPELVKPVFTKVT